MSVEHAKAFVEKVGSDPELLNKLEAATEEEKQDIAQGMGYNFTKDDLRQLAKVGEEELSEDELDAVAGGASAAWVGVGAGVVGAAAGVVGASAAAAA